MSDLFENWYDFWWDIKTIYIIHQHKSEHPVCSQGAQQAKMCARVFIFGNIILPVTNFGVVKKIKVFKDGRIQCIITVVFTLLPAHTQVLLIFMKVGNWIWPCSRCVVIGLLITKHLLLFLSCILFLHLVEVNFWDMPLKWECAVTVSEASINNKCTFFSSTF